MNHWKNWPPLPNQKLGDIPIFFEGWEVVHPGTSGQVLKSNGASARPSWVTIGGGASVVYIPFGSEAANGQTYAP